MIGDRIKQARSAAGLSQRGLAEKADISAMAVSKYENNKNTPSSGVLLALAEALSVRVEYFFRVIKVELQEVEYRKHAKLPAKILKQIESDVKEQIERYLVLEEYLPVSPIQQFELPKNLPKKINEYDDIEKVASTVRKAWGLGNNPIPDLIDTLEERGIKVFQSKALHDDKFDGLAAHVNGTPVIVVGHSWPGDRQRFTLSHELGHLIMKNILDDGLDEERAANRFAGAFLVPYSEVIKELGHSRSRLEPVELCILKDAYGLSMQGWLFRARDAGVLNYSASQKMWNLFNAKKWRINEPGEPYKAESPKLFLQLVLHACAEELINESKAAELLGMTTAQLRKMRNSGSCEQAAVN